MIPSLNPLWALPMIAGGLVLAVWLASKLYVEPKMELPEQTTQHVEVEEQLEPVK